MTASSHNNSDLVVNICIKFSSQLDAYNNKNKNNNNDSVLNSPYKAMCTNRERGRKRKCRQGKNKMKKKKCSRG